MQSFHFHPAVANWFEKVFGSPTEPQLRGWPEIQSRRHVLISTPTGFDGLRALLLPSDKRPTFGRNEGVRRRKTNLASIEFAGRWSLLRHAPTQNGEAAQQDSVQHARDESARTSAMEKVARVLLHRYGIVFRRLLERETFTVSRYELGRIFRRWEARGEIRGGYFVGGVSGEQSGN